MKPTKLAERFRSNNEIATVNRKDFDAARLTVVSIVGPAGSGKTSIIESLLSRLDPRVRTAVIIGNLAASRESARINRQGIQAIPLTTDNPTAAHVHEVLPELNLPGLDLLLIEANGNTLSPVEFDLGQHLRVGVFSTAGGDDKVTEYPFLVAGADLLILTKTDLLPFVTFNLDVFRQDVHQIKPGLEIIQTSVQHNQGIATWVNWLEFHAPLEKSVSKAPRLFRPLTDWSKE